MNKHIWGGKGTCWSQEVDWIAAASASPRQICHQAIGFPSCFFLASPQRRVAVWTLSFASFGVMMSNWSLLQKQDKKNISRIEPVTALQPFGYLARGVCSSSYTCCCTLLSGDEANLAVMSSMATNHPQIRDSPHGKDFREKSPKISKWAFQQKGRKFHGDAVRNTEWTLQLVDENHCGLSDWKSWHSCPRRAFWMFFA